MATVILVAIAIVIAIAVAFWATGLVGVFTRFEKLEIRAAYWDGSKVVLLVNNTGSATTTIDDVYVNGVPGATYSLSGTCDISGTKATCDPGEGVKIEITAPPTAIGSFANGVTYEVAVHTASGKLYPAAVLIP